MTLKEILNQKGLSLVEITVSMGLLGVLGIGYMTMSENHKKSSKGVKIVSDLDQSLVLIKDIINNPKVCEINFLNKKTGENVRVQDLLGVDQQPLVSENKKIAKDAYVITAITIGSYDPASSRTAIELDLTKSAKEATRSQNMRRTFRIFTEVNSQGVITKCLDPIDYTAIGARIKMCRDVDPQSTTDCLDNYDNLLAEVKRLFCGGGHYSFVKYDTATEKCVPIDAGSGCGSGFVQGYDGAGNLVCFSP